MAFRAENQKILLTLSQLEVLLGFPEGVEVVGFETHRDPPLLQVFIYNPHIDTEEIPNPNVELPILQVSYQPPEAPA